MRKNLKWDKVKFCDIYWCRMYNKRKQEANSFKWLNKVVMTKEEFKQRRESNANGGGITFDDIANCAQQWGLFKRPRTCDMQFVLYTVLKYAGVEDAEEYKPLHDN